ncbi:mucin-5AC-like [Neosynchiropus ocellatus]
MPLDWTIPWLVLCLGVGASSSDVRQDVSPTSLIEVYTTPSIEEVSHSDSKLYCSTWGNYHFKTFDGRYFNFPSTCNYVLASECKGYEGFYIHFQRQEIGGTVSIRRVLIKLNEFLVELFQSAVKVNDETVQLPFSKHGVYIDREDPYITIEAEVGLTIKWNERDSLWIELTDAELNNRICGLCAVESVNEGYHMLPYSVDAFKIDGSSLDCDDSSLYSYCERKPRTETCMRLLWGEAIFGCMHLIDWDSFIKACVEDLCSCRDSDSCLCSTVKEFSRQCAHAGGFPQLSHSFPQCGVEKCPFNMEYKECGSACKDTCSNPRTSDYCARDCVEGCSCPQGTVFDDITETGCVPVNKCPCLHDGKPKQSGESYIKKCQKCTCFGGEWRCSYESCPGECSLRGGSHMTTFDGKAYTFHGDCSYVLSKDKNGTFTISGDLAKCEVSASSCLLAVTLHLPNSRKIVVDSKGKVFVNNLMYPLPLKMDHVHVFRPSTFYIIVETSHGLMLEIQITPIMQLSISASASYKSNLQGLCGDFNDIEADDYKNLNGLPERTAPAFISTWEVRNNCPEAKRKLENPCSLSMDKEKYALESCSSLSDQHGIFAKCHSEIDPEEYEATCIYDTCTCRNSDACMCAAIASYVQACAAEGISLTGWRDTMCQTYTTCPSTFVYDYHMTSCGRTCRSLSQSDQTCHVKFTPVDGCGCARGTYLNEESRCVEASLCPCYMDDILVKPGQSKRVNGQICSCREGQLHCSETPQNRIAVCTQPMFFFNCSNETFDSKGSECQKTCQSVDTECESSHCVSGCVCPAGLLADNEGGCIREEQCPCTYNKMLFNPGEQIAVDCNTCICEGKKWDCTEHMCDRTFSVFGDGHFHTFDEKEFHFKGDCSYVLCQDFCGGGGVGSFKVLTKSIPSSKIELYLGNKKIEMSEEKVKIINTSSGNETAYHVRPVGKYMVIEAENGLVLMWDRKATLMIKLSATFKGKVCGACGNFDGNIKNDFTTRNKDIVADAYTFVNSWKVSPKCPDSVAQRQPCTIFSYRMAWAERHCSIIRSNVFADCHSKVPWESYYEACVKDMCECDPEDRVGFCSVVAVYAAACNEAGSCVRWRTPTICPIFCDYYNLEGGCEWHYEPCGKPCMKTCRNPSGECYNQIPALEGCYPRCPNEKPFLEDVSMKCVSIEQCGCYDDEGTHYGEGQVIPHQQNCHKCVCSTTDVNCTYDIQECTCKYGGKLYKYNETIYDTHDGNGTCIFAVCGENGNIKRVIEDCVTSTTERPTTTFSFSTPASTTKTTQCARSCKWSDWINMHNTEQGGGDYELLDVIADSVPGSCRKPTEIECRTVDRQVPFNQTQQEATCNVMVGLICHDKDQRLSPRCYDYEIRVKCCVSECLTTPTPITTTIRSTSTSKSTAPTTSESTTVTGETTMTTKTTERPTTTTTEQSQSTTKTTESSVPTTTRPFGSSTEEATTSSIPTVTTSTTTREHTSTSISTTTECARSCKWSDWINKNNTAQGGGDYELLEEIAQSVPGSCRKPTEIECRTVDRQVPFNQTQQEVTCNVMVGLICHDKDQGLSPRCYDYEIRVKCCVSECLTTPTPITTTIKSTSTSKPTASTTSESTTVTGETTTTTKTTERPTTTTTEQSQSTTKTTESSVPTTTRPFGSSTEEATTSSIPTVTTSTTTREHTSTPIFTTTEKVSSTSTKASTTSESTTVTGETTTTTKTTERPTTTTTEQSQSTTKTTESSVPTTTRPFGSSTEEATTSSIPTVTTSTSTKEHTTTSTTITTQCARSCKWSDWINKNNTAQGGGDYELLEEIAQSVPGSCRKPTEIECRTVDRQVPFNQTQQEVTCNVMVGLICHDKDQGLSPRCYDYEIRVKCCVSECLTTPTPITTTIKSTSTSKSTAPTTSESTTVTGESTMTTKTTERPTTTTTEQSQSTTKTTESSVPTTTRPFGSSTEEATTSSIPTVTTSTTTREHTSTSISTTTEKVSSTSTKASTTSESTTVTGETTMTTKTTERPTTTTTEQSQSTTKTTESSVPTTTRPFGSSTEEATTSSIPTVTTSTSTKEHTTTSTTITTQCARSCKWSDWINKNNTAQGGGDYELLEEIAQSVPGSCRKPTEIECRTVDRQVPFNQTQQEVTCNVMVGLICHDKDQGLSPRCYDYEIRVKCCVSECLTTPTPITTTIKSTSTSKPTASTTSESTTVTGETTTTTKTTERPTTTTTEQSQSTTKTTESSVPTTTRPFGSSTEEATTSSIPTASTTSESTTVTGETTTTTKTTERPTTTTTEQSQSTTKTTESSVPTTTRPFGSSTEEATTSSIPTVTTSTSTKEHTTTSTTITTQCARSCKWSDWINKNNTAQGGGDYELLEEIAQSVPGSCRKPTEIECRTVDRQVPFNQTQQEVTCNVMVGLICHDKDQGLSPRCYDYEIRVKCCVSECLTTPTPITTTIKSTSTSKSTAPTTSESTTVTGESTMTTKTTERPTTTTTEQSQSTTKTTESSVPTTTRPFGSSTEEATTSSIPTEATTSSIPTVTTSTTTREHTSTPISTTTEKVSSTSTKASTTSESTTVTGKTTMTTKTTERPTTTTTEQSQSTTKTTESSVPTTTRPFGSSTEEATTSSIPTVTTSTTAREHTSTPISTTTEKASSTSTKASTTSESTTVTGETTTTTKTTERPTTTTTEQSQSTTKTTESSVPTTTRPFGSSTEEATTSSIPTVTTSTTTREHTSTPISTTTEKVSSTSTKASTTSESTTVTGETTTTTKTTERPTTTTTEQSQSTTKTTESSVPTTTRPFGSSTEEATTSSIPTVTTSTTAREHTSTSISTTTEKTIRIIYRGGHHIFNSDCNNFHHGQRTHIHAHLHHHRQGIFHKHKGLDNK